MEDKDNQTHTKRQYPPLYERIVPVVLGVIVIAIVVLLFISVGVALGLFPGGR